MDAIAVEGLLELIGIGRIAHDPIEIDDRVKRRLQANPIVELMTLLSADHREAIRAFVEKRPAKFIGR